MNVETFRVGLKIRDLLYGEVSNPLTVPLLRYQFSKLRKKSWTLTGVWKNGAKFS